MFECNVMQKFTLIILEYKPLMFLTNTDNGQMRRRVLKSYYSAKCNENKHELIVYLHMHVIHLPSTCVYGTLPSSIVRCSFLFILPYIFWHLYLRMRFTTFLSHAKLPLPTVLYRLQTIWYAQMQIKTSNYKIG